MQSNAAVRIGLAAGLESRPSGWAIRHRIRFEDNTNQRNRKECANRSPVFPASYCCISAITPH